jgi:hypothetical protein
MSDAMVKRGERGRLLPGSVLNPGGRPRNAIEDVRERLGPHTPEFVTALVELVRSPNETTRLAAIREFFDRTLGKPPVAVDTTVAKVDLGALYLQAVQAANGSPPSDPIDITPAPDAPAEASATSPIDW